MRQVLYSYAFRLVKSLQWKANCKASTVIGLVLLFNVDDSLFIFSFFLLIQIHKYYVFLMYVHHFSHLLLLTHKHAIEGEYGDKIHSSKFFQSNKYRSFKKYNRAVHWNDSSKTKAFKIPGQVQMRSQTYVY
jgi:hypothetical protein